MPKTKREFIEELIEETYESIWTQEVEIFIRQEQINAVQQEIQEISQKLENGKYQLGTDAKKALREKNKKLEQLQFAQDELEKVTVSLENHNEKLAVLNRYMVQIGISH